MQYDLLLSVFDSSGHLVITLAQMQVAGPPSSLGVSTSVFTVDGTSQLSIASAAGDFSVLWNGMASDGSKAYPGTYIIQAKYKEFGKEVIEIRSVKVALVWGGSSMLSVMFLSPNPAGGAQGAVTRLTWPARPGYMIRAKIYNLAGELVQIHLEDMTKGSMDWNLGTASGQPVSNGVYIWALEILDSRGAVVERGFKKLVVMRK